MRRTNIFARPKLALILIKSALRENKLDPKNNAITVKYVKY